ncbi:MAG TPA: tetratricopeptide repeat protein [Candidatus Avalokitesvara rifleensis]|uniref:tetratricopeptide repeat protein n=1 Tax=Candidatus Avalokitesvara rifleensis TaxID=3367620 RepID=UPI002712FAD1|nr:tetratricopeptide repeat protein [Candidatus Brocadiales bacterium]
MRNRWPFKQALLAIVLCLIFMGGNMFTDVCCAQSQTAQGAGDGAKINIEELSQRPFEPLNVYMSTDQLEMDIKSCMELLVRYNEGKSPREYGILHIRIGFSYFVFEAAERDKNVSEAAQHFSVAAKVCGEKNLVKEYHEAEVGIGLTLIELTEGDHITNLHEAVKTLDEETKFFTKESNALAYAIVNNGLGSACAYLYNADGQKKENLEAGERYFNNVLSMTSKKEFPVQYAKAQIGLGMLYLDSFGASGDKLMMEKALSMLSNAREVFSESFFPTFYTKTFFLTALAYLRDGDYGKAKEVMEKTMKIADRTKDPRLEVYMNFFYSLEISKGLLE